MTQDLVVIDTGQITNIKIEEPANHIQLAREDGQWLLTTEDNIQVPTVESRVRSMISALDGLVPSRIASRDPDKWRDYQVDSTGRRVQVFQGQDKTLDLIIGRSSMQGQRTFISYVRPYLEDNVYVIENFSGSSVSANSANYRNKTVVDLTVDSIYQLQFETAGQERFSVLRTDNQWQLDEVLADSARTVEYLNELRRLTSSAFVDTGLPGTNVSPVASLTIASRGGDDVKIQLFDGAGGNQLVHSSQNPDNYFADTAVINQVFVQPAAFLPKQ